MRAEGNEPLVLLALLQPGNQHDVPLMLHLVFKLVTTLLCCNDVRHGASPILCDLPKAHAGVLNLLQSMWSC